MLGRFKLVPHVCGQNEERASCFKLQLVGDCRQGICSGTCLFPFHSHRQNRADNLHCIGHEG